MYVLVLLLLPLYFGARDKTMTTKKELVMDRSPTIFLKCHTKKVKVLLELL